MEGCSTSGPTRKAFFTSRGEKIISLIPKPGCDSSDELTDSEEWDEEKLEAGVRQLFEEIGIVDFESENEPVLSPPSVSSDEPNPEPTMTEVLVNKPEEPVPMQTMISPSESNPPTATPSATTRAMKRALSSAPQKGKGKASALKKKVKAKPLNMNWRKKKFQGCVTIPPRSMDKVHQDGAHIQTALSYFYKFFSLECIDLIVEQTNLYSFQQTGESIKVDRNAIKAFLGIELLMGIIQLPAITDYWSKRFRQCSIADVMSLKKFLKIRRFIHFTDNSEKNEDPFYKIRPIVELIRQNCQQVPPEGKYSVDEMMVPYKGTRAGARKQYMPNKPCKWGFKLFIRAGVSGMVYDMLLYCGSSTFMSVDFQPEEDAMPFSAQVVIALCKSIEDPPLSTIYCDNFFTSLPLLIYLRKQLGILGLGTIRANRTAHAPITPADEIKKKPRGWFEEISDNKKKLVLVQWLDTKPVLLTSSYVSVDPIGSIDRWSKAERAHVGVDCPHIITEYNSQMGGVDLCDMLIALYRTPLRSHRWYLTIFAQLIDICVVNAWLLYRRDTTTQPKNKRPKPKRGDKGKGKEETGNEGEREKASESGQNYDNAGCGEGASREVDDDSACGTGKDKIEKALLGNEDIEGRGSRRSQKLDGEPQMKRKKSNKKPDGDKKLKKTPDAESKELPLKEFRADIADGLIRSALNAGTKKGTSPFIKGKKKKNVEPSCQDTSGWPKNSEHIPSFTKKGKCRVCKVNQTIFYCAKCDMRLCLVPTRNCYSVHHNEDRESEMNNTD